jgi:hypothetical protein
VVSIELGGTARGSGYDALDIGGSATLAGLLAASVLPGFEISIANDDVFEIAIASSFLGSFANAASGARITSLDGLTSFEVHYGAGSPYGGDRLVLADWSPVPEPGTATLVLAGLAILARWRRAGRAQSRRTGGASFIGAPFASSWRR